MPSGAVRFSVVRNSCDGIPAPTDRKVDIRLHGKWNSNSRGARLVCQHLVDDKVDSDQWVVNRETLSLRPPALSGGRTRLFQVLALHWRSNPATCIPDHGNRNTVLKSFQVAKVL